eukprot:2623065-Rhodomonas_salina.3
MPKVSTGHRIGGPPISVSGHRIPKYPRAGSGSGIVYPVCGSQASQSKRVGQTVAGLAWATEDEVVGEREEG